MNIPFNKRAIGSIVLVLLIVIGAYFGSRWAYRDLPGDTVKAPSSSPSVKASLADTGDGEMILTPSAPAPTGEGEGLGNPPALEATVESYQETLSQVIVRNEQLKRMGVPIRERI